MITLNYEYEHLDYFNEIVLAFYIRTTFLGIK